MGKREIARAFGVTGAERIELKRLLKEMAEEGLIDGAAGSISIRRATSPPSPCWQSKGSTIRARRSAVPVEVGRGRWGAAPRIVGVEPEPKVRGGKTRGARHRRPRARAPHAREEGETGGDLTARVIKLLEREPKGRRLGIFHHVEGGGGGIVPIDRRGAEELTVSFEAARGGGCGRTASLSG